MTAVPDQQLSITRQFLKNANSLAPTESNLSETRDGGPAFCVLTNPPSDSNAWSSVRTTAQRQELANFF